MRMIDFWFTVVVFIQAALTSPEKEIADHLGHGYDVEIQILCFFGVADTWLGEWEGHRKRPKVFGTFSDLAIKLSNMDIHSPNHSLKKRHWIRYCKPAFSNQVEHVCFRELIHCISSCPFLVGVLNITFKGLKIFRWWQCILIVWRVFSRGGFFAKPVTWNTSRQGLVLSKKK